MRGNNQGGANVPRADARNLLATQPETVNPASDEKLSVLLWSEKLAMIMLSNMSKLKGQSFLLVSLLFCLDPKLAMAQGTLPALTVSNSSGSNVYSQNVVGYYNGGVGWTFVPLVDLSVTDINYGASNSSLLINFWLGTNQIIASYTNSSGLGSESVSPLLLTAGSLYSITIQKTNLSSSTVAFSVFSLHGEAGLPVFTPSPYISQFASYDISQSGQWLSTTTPASDNINYLFLGPNFQFQVVPEPTSGEILLLMIVGFVLQRITVKTRQIH